MKKQPDPSEHPTVVLRRLHRWRMALSGLMILIAGITLGAAGTVVIVRPHQSQITPPAPPDIQTEREIRTMQRMLHLGRDQVDQIELILRQHFEALRKIRNDALPLINAEYEKMKVAVMEVLTEDQRTQWADITEDLERMVYHGFPPDGRGRRGGRGGFGGGFGGGPDRSGFDGFGGGPDRSGFDGFGGGPDSSGFDGFGGGSDRSGFDGFGGGSDRSGFDGFGGGPGRSGFDGFGGGPGRSGFDGFGGGLGRSGFGGFGGFGQSPDFNDFWRMSERGGFPAFDPNAMRRSPDGRGDPNGFPRGMMDFRGGRNGPPDRSFSRRGTEPMTVDPNAETDAPVEPNGMP